MPNTIAITEPDTEILNEHGRSVSMTWNRPEVSPGRMVRIMVSYSPLNREYVTKMYLLDKSGQYTYLNPDPTHSLTVADEPAARYSRLRLLRLAQTARASLLPSLLATGDSRVARLYAGLPWEFPTA